MGKAVPRGIKSRVDELMEKFPDQFTSDFEANKAFLDAQEFPFNKTTRNLIAGFITRKINAASKA